MAVDRDPSFPLISLPGAAVALVLAFILCWPSWLLGAAWWFVDTATYLKGGAAIWSFAMDALPFSGADGAGGSPAGATGGGPAMEDAGAVTARSFTSSFVIYTSWLLGGHLGIALLQTWIVVFVAFAMITPAALTRPTILALGAVWVGLATSLPWAGVFLLPDILAAVPILFAVVLALRWDALGRWQALVLTLLAAYAASSHYGHVPLAAGMMGLALAVRLAVRRRMELSALAAAGFVVALGPLFHLGVSAQALDTPSTAPLRLPILLARSIEDGPARWYLEEACPEADLAICEVLGDDIPDDVGEFLWTGSGIAKASPEQMGRVRAEEAQVLIAAFLDYPVDQIVSIFGNAARQFVMVDVPGAPRAGITAAFRSVDLTEGHVAQRAARVFDQVVVWGTAVGLMAGSLALLVAGPKPAHFWALGIVVAGLALNAAIFGGLSAPAARYQSRVIWIPILVLILCLADALARARRPQVPA